MVLSADPVFRALEAVSAEGKKRIYPSPRGKILDESKIHELAAEEELVLVCGHYEGLDQRVLDYWDLEEISIGDYVLTGGELAAMVMVDAVSRMLPGTLGNQESHKEESIYSGLLEYPQYTKPREYRGMEVPDTLVNGNHKKIRLWQFEASLRLTRERRPDLFAQYIRNPGELTKDERKILEKIKDMM